MIELTNTFHNTTARVRAELDCYDISAATERRVWRKLCGMRDCTCSGYGGVRGGDYTLQERPAPMDPKAKPYRVTLPA
jgi:hypothetical protein